MPSLRPPFASLLCACAVAAAHAPCAAQESPARQQQQHQQSRTEAYLETVERAEARTNAKEWAEAAALWERAAALNPAGGRAYFQLAVARRNAGDLRGSSAAYEKVIERGWGSPAGMAYQIAVNHARLGDRDGALRWLDKSFQMGYRQVEEARRDPEFKALSTDARFRDIVGLPDPARKMTRDEGWRFDLALLAREIRRVGIAPPLRRNEAEVAAAVRQLHDAIPRLTDAQVVVEMMKMMRKVDDGHTGIIPASRPEFQQALPVQMYLFEEGLFVIAADPKHKDLLGAQVIKLGDQTPEAVGRALDPLIPRDNEMGVPQRIPYLMRHPGLLHALGLVPDPRGVTLVVRAAPNGAERAVRVEADASQPNIWNVRPHPAGWSGLPWTITAAPVPLYLKNMGAPYWFEHLPESRLVYAQINSIRNDRNESFAQFSERLLKSVEGRDDADALVLDLRWNNGGNTFLTTPLVHGLVRSAKLGQRGRLFVVIGRRTFSAAQNLATYIERHANPVFVGEATGSSPNFVGEEEFFTLPYSGILANVSELLWQSAWPGDERKWIAPHVYAPPTFEHFRANRDPALEAVADYRKRTEGSTRAGS